MGPTLGSEPWGMAVTTDLSWTCWILKAWRISKSGISCFSRLSLDTLSRLQGQLTLTHFGRVSAWRYCCGDSAWLFILGQVDQNPPVVQCIGTGPSVQCVQCVLCLKNCGVGKSQKPTTQLMSCVCKCHLFLRLSKWLDNPTLWESIAIGIVLFASTFRC